jgi:hypothetical protein
MLRRSTQEGLAEVMSAATLTVARGLGFRIKWDARSRVLSVVGFGRS